MKQFYFKNLFLPILFMLCVPIWAQEDPIAISSSVDKARIRIGDLITYTVTVTHDKDIQVEMPGLGANLGGFEIRDYQVYDPKKEEGQIVSQVDYIISTFFTFLSLILTIFILKSFHIRIVFSLGKTPSNKSNRNPFKVW